jgi:hypothetical protein
MILVSSSASLPPQVVKKHKQEAEAMQNRMKMLASEQKVREHLIINDNYGEDSETVNTDQMIMFNSNRKPRMKA